MTEPRPLSEHLADVRAAQPTTHRPVERPPATGSPDEIARRRQLIADRRWSELVPPRFANAHVDGLDSKVRADLAEWVADRRRPNVVLVGPVGTGKTWAAFAIVRALIENGVDVDVVTVADWLDELRKAMNTDAAMTRNTRVEVDHASRVDVLVLDDVGAERPTEWSGERVTQLIDRRWREDLPIIATTNLEPGPDSPLMRAVGERAYSRLVGGAIVIRISGDDRRRQR